MPETWRLANHCGFRSPSEWPPYSGPPNFAPGSPSLIHDEGGEPLEQGEIVCPGWLATRPVVHEAWDAREAREHGSLGLYYPNQENTILEAAKIAQRALDVYQAAEIERLKKES